MQSNYFTSAIVFCIAIIDTRLESLQEGCQYKWNKIFIIQSRTGLFLRCPIKHVIRWAFFSSNILFQHFLSFFLFLLQSYTVYKHYGQMLPKQNIIDQVMIHISSLLMPFRQHFLTKRAAYKDIFRNAFIVTIAGGSEMTPINLSLWTLTILCISVLELCII